MSKMFFKFSVLLPSFVLLGLVLSAPGIRAGQEETESDAIRKMEDTIKKQGETIKKLQSEINKLQEGAVRASGQQPPPSEPDPVEQALRESWNSSIANSREVVVTDGIVSIYFKNIHDLIAFFESGADVHARSDLAVFLKKTGLEHGTIEYYSTEKRLYAISGTLAKSEIKQYYY